MPFADNPTACTNKCPQFSISAQQNCIAGQLCLIFVPKHTIYLHIRLYTTRFPLYGLVPAIQNCANNLQQSSCAQHSVCFFRSDTCTTSRRSRVRRTASWHCGKRGASTSQPSLTSWRHCRWCQGLTLLLSSSRLLKTKRSLVVWCQMMIWRSDSCYVTWQLHPRDVDVIV